jgi:hypothetical protein
MPQLILTRRLPLLLTLLTLTVAPADAAVQCVNPGGTDGCFATIQAAIDAADHLDTIQIAAGTYHEKVSMTPPNNKWLLIQGAGAEKTIVDGTGVPGPFDPVFNFQVNPNPGPTVTVSDLTIRGGYRGVNAGRFVNLTLQNVVVRDNGIGSGAGVINNASFVTIIGSIIRDNTADDAFFGCDGSGGAGGGIASLCGGGSYTIVNSAVINNTAKFGGGIAYVNGQQTIINSTLSGNKTTQPDSIGGAIMSFADDFHMTNTTVARNSTRAGGGALALFGATQQVKASVIDGNTGDNCLTGMPPVSSLGYNVSSDASCGLSGPGDLSGVSARLDPLANNGGRTPTHALRRRSPAIDLVPRSLCPAPATDQRGVRRPHGEACDSGSFEKRRSDDDDHHDDDHHGGDHDSHDRH